MTDLFRSNVRFGSGFVPWGIEWVHGHGL